MSRIALVAFLVVACGRQRLAERLPVPPLGHLTVIDSIPFTDSAPISSAIGTAGCGVLVANARRGSITWRRPNGVSAAIAKVPGWWPFPQLVALDDQRALVWSSAPPYLGVLDLDHATLDSVPLARHPWGGAEIGPVVGLSGDSYAVAPVSDPFHLRREPPTRVAVALISERTLRGAPLAALGRITERGGQYLSWRDARAAIGRADSAILVAFLSRGTLLRVTTTQVDTFQLPSYYDAPPEREEIQTLPWIQIHGDVPSFVDAQPLAAAAFSPSGRAYVVRNYRFAWVSGGWQSTKRGLEIYSPTGKRLGAYELPDTVAQVGGLTADDRGRIFVYQGRRVFVVRDPTAHGAC